MDSGVLNASDPLRPAADSFVLRLRRGERPTFAEYTERYPDQAHRIREIFPKLLATERRASDHGATGPFGPVDGAHHVPKNIGDYQIVREIARGGMGIVYEAVQESLDRQVALKVLPSGPFSRGPYLERFYREARAAGRLHHTNIVPVFGVGDADGIHYYAMQYIEGMGLDAVVKEVRQRRGLPELAHGNDTKADNKRTRDHSDVAPLGDFELGPKSILPDSTADSAELSIVNKNLADLAASTGAPYFRSVARLGVQVAEALAYAHNQNVLHRDIKPSNLLLDRYGILWITDFGLAKLEGDDLSAPDDIVGTLRYMAPERFKATSESRSDIYALGMTLYEMIALKPAFDDQDRFRLVERINNDRPKRLREIDPELPRDLETIIFKSIQRDSIHRYASAAEMADDLRRFLTDRPIAARRASRFEELRRWCRRNPVVTGLAGLVFVMGFVLAAVVFRAYVSIRHERDLVESQKKRTESAEIFSNQKLWTSNLTTARLRRSLHAVGQRFAALDALSDARRDRPEPVLANEAAASLALPDIRRTNSWEGWPEGTVAVHFDASFERYARSNGVGAISVRNTVGDVEIAELPGLGGPAYPQFGHTGRFLAVRHGNDNMLAVWRVSDDAKLKVIDGLTGVASVAFAPDDKLIAVVRLDGTVEIHELPSGRLTRSLSIGATALSADFRADGKQIAVAAGDEVAIFDCAAGTEITRFEVAGEATRVVWHPDGRHLAVGTDDGRIRIYRQPGVEPAIVIASGVTGTSEIAFHPEGIALVSWGNDRTIRLWNPFNGKLLLAATGVVSQPRFSQDGRNFGPEIDGSRVHVLEMATGHECLTLVPATGSATFHDGAVSPDNRVLAVATTDGVVIWNLTNGEELARLPTGDTVGCLFLNSGELLTSGARGVIAWPITINAEESTIGPPRSLANWPAERLARSADDSIIAVATKVQGAVILDRERPTIRNTLLSHESAAYLSVNPDGKLIATGTHNGRNVRIWDATTNRLMRELDIKAGSAVAFSPDGRWLATDRNNDGVRLWSTNDWKQARELPADQLSRIAFSPRQPLVAVESGKGSIRIYDPATGELRAELEDPDRARATWLAFTPDGSRIIAANVDSHCVRVWNLAELRRGLDSYGFEWPIAAARPTSTPPIARMRVLGVELLASDLQAKWAAVTATLAALTRCHDADLMVRRGAALADLGFENLATSDYGTALRLRSDHAEAAFQRGSKFFASRQWEQALEDFTRAMNRPALADVARWMRGKSLLQLDRVEEMMAEVNGLLEHYPDDPQLYYQRALGHSYRQRYAAAIGDLETALRKGPSHQQALNNLAWILVTGPPDCRDPDRALGLAQRAARLDPQRATFQNTLGVCLYRLGRFRESLSALEKSQLAGRGQFDGYDLYIMAMCYHKLEELAKCHQCMTRASAWEGATKLTAHERMELNRFRSEAEELVGSAP